MIKRITNRFFLGIPFGITLGLIVTIVFAYLTNQTFYQMIVNRFGNYANNSLDNLTVTVILWALLGSLFFVAALIFTIEYWSFVKKVIIHFFVTVSVFMVIAYALGWYSLSVGGFIDQIITFIVIYALFFVHDMVQAKRNVTAINNKLKREDNS